MWKTVNYEICGRSHLKTETPCQDRTIAIIENEVQVIALADGAGSAKYSHVGAEVAVHSTSKFITEKFDDLIHIQDGNKVKDMIYNHIRRALKLETQGLCCEYKDLASTLLLVAIKGNQFIIIHVGDGVIGYIKDGELLVASKPDNGEFVNTTVFLTSSNAMTSTRLFKGEINNISGFVLMSDGTAESFYHKKTKTLTPAIKKMINWTALLNSEKMHSLVSDSFNHIVKMNTQDDCSIAIIALSSNQRDEYFTMSIKEKCELLGINTAYPKNALRQVERYNKIIKYLQVPRTLADISKLIHLNPKYTKKRIRRLMEKGLIIKQSNLYCLEENLL